jgi:antitoxin ParD1/3/4
MANTSLSLGKHWEAFIRGEIASGRYGSASEVVRDALRSLEERKGRIEALRNHLAEGAEQARQGKFVPGYSIDGVIDALDAEGCLPRSG